VSPEIDRRIKYFKNGVAVIGPQLTELV